MNDNAVSPVICFLAWLSPLSGVRCLSWKTRSGFSSGFSLNAHRRFLPSPVPPFFSSFRPPSSFLPSVRTSISLPLSILPSILHPSLSPFLLSFFFLSPSPSLLRSFAPATQTVSFFLPLFLVTQHLKSFTRLLVTFACHVTLTITSFHSLQLS